MMSKERVLVKTAMSIDRIDSFEDFFHTNTNNTILVYKFNLEYNFKIGVYFEIVFKIDLA